jgi:uncharacterized membrane-anchored protein YjiN (DUF445 family)
MAKRNKADIILALTAVCFVGVLLLRYLYPGEFLYRVLLAVTEAALVGGLADWFAVTALFRKPLGFSWHTAIIPRNRERVIAGIAGAVEHDLLSVTALKKRLAALRFADLLTDWLENKDGRRIFRNVLNYFLQCILEKLDPGQIAGLLERLLKSRAKDWLFAPQLCELLTWVLDHRKEEELVVYVLDELARQAQGPVARETILRHLRQYTKDATGAWWQKLALELGMVTDSINLEEAAGALQNELCRLLGQMQDSAHPLRRWLRLRLEEIARRLTSDPAWMAAVETWKEGFLERTDLNEVLTRLTEYALQRGQRPALAWTLQQIERYWDGVREDQGKLAWLEGYCQDMVFRIIETEHHWIGTAARDALTILTDEDLNGFVEGKAGDDLQWIRINGSLVGGLVGLLLFLFGHFVYDPYLLPVMQKYLQ